MTLFTQYPSISVRGESSRYLLINMTMCISIMIKTCRCVGELENKSCCSINFTLNPSRILIRTRFFFCILSALIRYIWIRAKQSESLEISWAAMCEWSRRSQGCENSHINDFLKFKKNSNLKLSLELKMAVKKLRWRQLQNFIFFTGNLQSAERSNKTATFLSSTYDTLASLLFQELYLNANDCLCRTK